MKPVNRFLNGVTLLSSLLIVGCASGPRVQEVDIEEPQFKVLEAAPGGREEWIDSPNSFAKKMGKDEGFDTEKYYYYTGEAKAASKRMSCEKAQANVTDDISRQVAVFVDSSIAKASNEFAQESSDGISASGEVNEEIERISSQLSKTSLHGVVQQKKYWEKRDYSQAGGARAIYYCWVLNYVNQDSISKMVQRASRLRVGSNNALKAKVETQLNNIDKEYQQYMLMH